MTIWIPYKAKPNEKNKARVLNNRQRYCRICGKTTAGGTLCSACLKKRKEQQA